MAEATYLGEPQLGLGGLPWAEDRLGHPQGVNCHSPPGGECLNGKILMNVSFLLRENLLRCCVNNV